MTTKSHTYEFELRVLKLAYAIRVNGVPAPSALLAVARMSAASSTGFPQLSRKIGLGHPRILILILRASRIGMALTTPT